MSTGDRGIVNSCAYLLDRHVEEGRGDRVAVRAGEGESTYRELHAGAAAAAGAFAAQGVDRGDRILLQLPDSPAFVVAFLGLLRIGAVPVPLNARLATPESALSTGELVHVIDHCHPSGAVASGANVPRLLGVASQLPPERVWAVGSEDVAVIDGTRSFDADLAAGTGHPPTAPVAGEDVAMILYTSGTTGTPKGVVHTHRALRGCREGCFDRPFAISVDDLCFSTASLSFAYGLYSMLHTLAAGAGFLLDEGPRMPHLVLECLRTRSPSVLFSTPRVYTDVVSVAEANPEIEVVPPRLCISSGEVAPEQLHERWRRRFGAKLIDVVGATETLRPFLVPDPMSEQPTAARRPAPGCEVDLRDQRGQSVGEMEPGEIFVRTSCNAARYWDDERETAATMRDGWVRSGDVALRDASDNYVLLGRSDQIAKVRGQRVVAGEIERCLHSHELVLECAVVIVTGADGLATTVAFVEPDRAEDHGDLARLLRRHCRGRLAPHKVPAHVAPVEALPRTSNGKIARGRLREEGAELARTGTTEGGGRPTGREQRVR